MRFSGFLKGCLYLVVPALLGIYSGLAMAEDAPTPPDYRSTAKFMGRWDFSSATGPLGAWSGSTVSARFTGKTISATLRPAGSNVWITFVVDGKITNSMKLTKKGTYVLADNLSDGEHTVEIVKRSEGGEGDLQFMGFEVPAGGKLLPPPGDSPHKIGFIGDSITCGYGIDGKPDSPWNIATENFLETYSYLTAKHFNADYQAIAWSGKGMHQNYNPEVKGPTMVEIYNQVRPSKAKLQWDMKAWIPDAVVIYLGTNDFFAPIDKDKFVGTYGAFLQTLREYYPNATIFCAFLSRADIDPSIRKVVETANIAGDKNVHAFFFSPEDVAKNGTGSGNHPSLTTHAIMASELEAEIQRVMKW